MHILLVSDQMKNADLQFSYQKSYQYRKRCFKRQHTVGILLLNLQRRHAYTVSYLVRYKIITLSVALEIFILKFIVLKMGSASKPIMNRCCQHHHLHTWTPFKILPS